MRTIAVISGSRADAGLLMGLMNTIREHPLLDLQLFVTGMHLSEQHGFSYRELEKNGFSITAKVTTSLTDNSPQGNARALAEGIIGFTEVLHKFQPDIVLLLGDRFEILAAAETAMMLQIPLAHLHGGELTLGAIDDAIRHSISKMAQLHFTATDRYRQRLIQMGEQPERVYNTGATAVDNILTIPLLNKQQLEQELKISLIDKLFLITWHPETINADILSGLIELCAALKEFPEHQVIFTKANADSGGEQINQALQHYVQQNSNYSLFSSLGIQNYLSLVKIAALVLGNSSSALLEVPVLKKASVNIGHRQDGRYKPESVIDCASNRKHIVQAILSACSSEHKKRCQNMELPYGDGHSCAKITRILAEVDLSNIMYKPFYDIIF